ncbi:MAG TPA: GAF domain-containing SpoIIE family protein phosphatase [Acidobacteriota bacterium]|nr:GAF domain-containing SpoIIE family protein phosphatase [Acidobacteriota bacterium]
MKSGQLIPFPGDSPETPRPGAKEAFDPLDQYDQALTLSLLHDIGRELSSILGTDPLLKRIAELVGDLIDHQVFSLYLLDAARNQLTRRFVRATGQSSETPKILKVGQGVCGKAAQKRHSIRISDLHRYPRARRAVLDPKVRSLLSAPLVRKESVVGVVNLESHRVDAFSARHEKILGTLASSIAIALENARLYEELSRKERSLENDLRMARRVQKGLLPASVPSLKGLEIGSAYRPCRHLGGDFYDFQRTRSDSLAVAVGDVSGKSTAAALYGSLAIGILRSQITQYHRSPADLLRHVNTHLLRTSLDSRFLALTLASYHAGQRRLTLANAGLPRPLLVRGGRVRELDLAGIPLGLFAGTKYDQQSVDLETGDLVVMATDGIHESCDQEQREFGSLLQQRLCELSGHDAQDIADALLCDSQTHGSSNPDFEDDRTIVVLKCVG